MMSATTEGFCSIEEALQELRKGRMIVLVDDEHRENEGDLVIAAEAASPETVNFMLTHGRGIVCLAMSEAICDRLHLHPQSAVNNARTGIDTGTSAFDRARSIKTAVDPRSTQAVLVSYEQRR